MKKFKDLVQSLDEKKKFKLPRGEQEIDSYMEKGVKGKKQAQCLLLGNKRGRSYTSPGQAAMVVVHRWMK